MALPDAAGPPAETILVYLVIGGLLGMLGQVARTIAGMKTLSDWAASQGTPAGDLFVVSRMAVSLVIGAAAGIAAVVGLGFDKPITHAMLLGIAAAGYAGTDFIEAFISRIPIAPRPVAALNPTPAAPPPVAAPPPPAPTALALFGTLGDALDNVIPASVRLMFPYTALAPIARNLQSVLQGLREAALVDRVMVLKSLATIRCETEGFEPISEFISRFNTAKIPFDLYDPGTHIGAVLGNTQPGDGARFKGRGYVQLTGRNNYAKLGKEISCDLIGVPEFANHPDWAGRILAQFLKDQESAIRRAIASNDLATARKAVNGGTHGLPAFSDAWRRGDAALPRWE